MRLALFMSCCSNASLSSSVMKYVFGFLQDKDSRLENPQLFSQLFCDFVKPQIQDYEFVHMFYCVLDRSCMKLKYCFFGDMVLLHQTKEGLKVHQSPCSPLSLKDNLTIKTETLDIERNDCFVFCSPE